MQIRRIRIKNPKTHDPLAHTPLDLANVAKRAINIPPPMITTTTNPKTIITISLSSL